MMRFASLSMRRQLVLLMVAASACSLLVAGAASVLTEVNRSRQTLAQELESLARLLGNRSSAALVFEDEATARQNLQALAGLRQVSLACLLNANGRTFASYAAAPGPECAALGPVPAPVLDFDGLLVRVQMPVVEDGRTVGALVLHSGRNLLRERLLLQGLSLLPALAGGLLLAWLLSWRLQRVVSQPVMRVRAVAEAIGGRGDTSLRAPDLGHNEVGQLARAFNRMLDMLKQRNDDLAAREAYSRRLFHGSRVAQLVLDTGGRCVDCNDAAALLLTQGDRQRLIGRLLAELRADADGAEPVDVAAAAGGPAVHWAMRRPDGQGWDAQIDVVLFEAAGAALLHCLVQDVSAGRAAEAARRAQLAAESASQAKSQFLSGISHELRTPMNAVLGFLQLLHRDARHRLDADSARHLDISQQAAWHLLALIEDLLDVSRIESGQLSVQALPMALDGVIEQVRALCEADAERAGVRLSVSAQGLPAVRADPTRLRQVLLNLLTNAVKYNRRGGLAELVVHRQGDEVALKVRDDGIGMSLEQQARLYEPFNRLGRESGPVAGTGLGLWLTRELVQLMGGRIVIESELQRGTTVTVTLAAADLETVAAPAAAFATEPTLPVAAADASAGTDMEADAGQDGVPTEAAAARSGPRLYDVLYVEDNPVNSMLVAECLRPLSDVHLRVAATGEEAVAAVQAQMPDLLLLDMQLPDLSGLQIMARLQAAHGAALCAVVALSASAMPEEVERARRGGIVRYWTKPIDLRRFSADVRELLDASALRPAPSPLVPTLAPPAPGD